MRYPGDDEESYSYDDRDESDSSEETPSESGSESDEVADGAPTDGLYAPSEAEVDGDFDRLVREIRGAEAGSGPGMLNRVWDVNLEQKEAEFRDDLRAASGVGKRKRRGRRAGPVLSQQVRALIGEGNQAYVDNNLPETIRIMLEVIRIEPRAASAWSVLAQCYSDMNEPQKALQLRIMSAHLHQDPEEWEQLAEQSKSMGFHQQALYCYRKLYNLDPSNVNALWDRASLAKEIGEFKTARHALLAILKRIPHDLSVLDELRPVLIELNDLKLCASLYHDAFEHCQATFPSGVGINANTQTELPGGGFGLMEILVLADMYNTLGEHQHAIETIRRGCRWLQGRAQQKFWDACEDDREYDIMLGTRGGEGELQPGLNPLDVNARHRLAIARIKMGDIDEGQIHANIVLAQEATEYAALFAEIADAYFEREMYAEALRIYEVLGEDPATSGLYVLLQVAACRRMIGDLKEAAEVYEQVMAADPTHNEAKMKLAEIYEALNEPNRALDLVLQVINSRKRRPGMRQGLGGQTADFVDTSLFDEKARSKGKVKANKLTPAQLRELEAQKEREAMQSYHRIKELWPRMLQSEEDAEREWLLEAEKLVESFRETRNLFLASRHQGFRGMFPRSSKRRAAEVSEESVASRLQLEIGRESMLRKSKFDGPAVQSLDTFRTISFDNWLRLFMQYSFVLTKRGEHALADEVLRHVSYSNAFQNPMAQDTIRYALITCAISAGRLDIVVEQSRKLVNTHQFNNEPLRILLASLGSGLHATDAFLVSTLSKHLLRDIKCADAAVKSKEALRWNATTKRYALTTGHSKGDEGEEEEDEEVVGAVADSAAAVRGSSVALDGQQQHVHLPTKDNPVNVAVYGQICLAARSFQSALFYLLHAYDYCPNDAMICLCLAIASVGRAMQRQADNRHHLITQGMAFLSRYRELRGTDAEGMDEVEYNFGRIFQQLGLHTLAVRHYERVLELAENQLKVTNQNYGLAREAAYNLSLIYVTTGATPLAEALCRRWLSL